MEEIFNLEVDKINPIHTNTIQLNVAFNPFLNKFCPLYLYYIYWSAMAGKLESCYAGVTWNLLRFF